MEKEISIQPKKKKKFRKEYFILVIMAALIIVSALQTYSLMTLRTNLGKGLIKPVNTGQSTPMPNSLQNLPDMVGGC